MLLATECSAYGQVQLRTQNSKNENGLLAVSNRQPLGLVVISGRGATAVLALFLPITFSPLLRLLQSLPATTAAFPLRALPFQGMFQPKYNILSSLTSPCCRGVETQVVRLGICGYMHIYFTRHLLSDAHASHISARNYSFCAGT